MELVNYIFKDILKCQNMSFVRRFHQLLKGIPTRDYSGGFEEKVVRKHLLRDAALNTFLSREQELGIADQLLLNPLITSSEHFLLNCWLKGALRPSSLHNQLGNLQLGVSTFCYYRNASRRHMCKKFVFKMLANSCVSLR